MHELQRGGASFQRGVPGCIDLTHPVFADGVPTAKEDNKNSVRILFTKSFILSGGATMEYMEVIRQAVRAHNFEFTYASASTRDPLSQGIFYLKSDTPDTTVTESMAQPFVKSFMTGMGFVDTTPTMETPGGPPGTSHQIQPATSTFSN